MNNVGQPECVTKDRVTALFRDELRTATWATGATATATATSSRRH